MSYRIAVVGGGFSGLISAWLLEAAGRSGIEVNIFEAASRLGGRVLTRAFSDTDISYDAGAAELYDIHGSPKLRQLVDCLGLASTPMTATPFFVDEDEVLRDEDDFRRYLGPAGFEALNGFWRRGLSLRPPEAYANAGHPSDGAHPWADVAFEEALGLIGHDKARRFTEFQVHSDVATEPDRTTALYGFDNLLIDHPGYCSMYTLDGGNETLIGALADRAGAHVELSTRVVSVAPGPGGRLQVVTAANGNGLKTESFDAVLCTLPAPELPHVHWDDPELARRVGAHVEQHDYPADYVRISALFREPLWRDEFSEDYFVSSAFDGVTVYDKTPREDDPDYGVLSWLIGGAAASRAARMNEADLLAEAIDSLPPAFDGAAEAVTASEVDRWTAGVSRLPGGSPIGSLERRHTPDPRLPGLVFAGDYLYDATLCGALDAALYCCRHLLELAGRSLSQEAVWAAAVTSEYRGIEPPAASAGGLYFLRNLAERVC